jgi:hypothetical protein
MMVRTIQECRNVAFYNQILAPKALTVSKVLPFVCMVFWLRVTFLAVLFTELPAGWHSRFGQATSVLVWVISRLLPITAATGFLLVATATLLYP